MRRTLGYLDGIGAALGGLALVVLVWVGLRGGDIAAMYAELRGAVPAITRLVLHPAWRLGVPAVVLFALVLAHVRGRHRLAVIAVGLAATALAITTYAALYYPLWALAGNITG